MLRQNYRSGTSKISVMLRSETGGICVTSVTTAAIGHRRKARLIINIRSLYLCISSGKVVEAGT
jgi:hypothetical protein